MRKVLILFMSCIVPLTSLANKIPISITASTGTGFYVHPVFDNVLLRSSPAYDALQAINPVAISTELESLYGCKFSNIGEPEIRTSHFSEFSFQTSGGTQNFPVIFPTKADLEPGYVGWRSTARQTGDYAYFRDGFTDKSTDTIWVPANYHCAQTWSSTVSITGQYAYVTQYNSSDNPLPRIATAKKINVSPASKTSTEILRGGLFSSISITAMNCDEGLLSIDAAGPGVRLTLLTPAGAPPLDVRFKGRSICTLGMNCALTASVGELTLRAVDPTVMKHNGTTTPVTVNVSLD